MSIWRWCKYMVPTEIPGDATHMRFVCMLKILTKFSHPCSICLIVHLAQGDSLVLHRQFHDHTSALNHHDHQRIVNSLNSNCVDCSSKGGQKSNRAKHPCTICFKTFTHGFTLKRHIMQTHTQNRLSFYCELCSKNYSCRDSFLRHKKSSSHRQQSEFR